VISEALGYGSEKVTQAYSKNFGNDEVNYVLLA
jgi:hypothetical protein